MSRSGGHVSLLGGNLVVASVLAVLSYCPFEYVAKGTLLVLAFLFIVDPFPPLSRIVALISLVVVSILSRLYQNHVAIEQGEVLVVDGDATAASCNQAVAQDEGLSKTGPNRTCKNE